MALPITQSSMRHLDAFLVSIEAITILLVTPIAPLTTASAGQEDITSGAYWKYQTEIDISSLNLAGTVTITYNGQVEKDVEGQDYLLDHYYWEGSLDITGYYSAGSANGTATSRGHEYISSTTGYEVLSDMNMSLNFTTCYGSLDQNNYHHWQHLMTSFLPPGGAGDEPGTKELGTNWTKTFTVHMTSQGTFFWGEFFDIDVIEERTYAYRVEWISPVSLSSGDFDCTELRSACQKDIFTEWQSEEVGQPVKILKWYDDVRAYHSSEEWNMTLESYDLEPSNRAEIMVGIGGLVGASAILIGIASFVRWRIGNAKRR